VLNGRMIDELEKDLKGSGPCLIGGAVLEFAWRE
jgi:hypothetical protein